MEFDIGNLFLNSYVGMQVCQVLTRLQFSSYLINNTLLPCAVVVLF